MISINQLLESVDLDFEPRFVTKSRNGYVEIWSDEPTVGATTWYHSSDDTIYQSICRLKLAEFENKPWQECIYEVPRKTDEYEQNLEKLRPADSDLVYRVNLPRKTTGKIEKLPELDHTEASIFHVERLHSVVNELVGYVNALIESNNIHEKQIDELQMKLEPEKCAVNELKGAKNE